MISMEKTGSKLCINCAHYQAGKMGLSTDRCMEPTIQPAPDLVRGEARSVYCELVRADEARCGRAAKLFVSAVAKAAE